MPAPTKDQVRTDTIQIISAFTTLSPDEIEDKHVLKAPPLLFDDIGLGFLAQSLRGYVKQYNKNATVTATELRKPGMTAGSTILLIQQRVEAV